MQIIRQVSPRRAKVLRNRNEDVKWCVDNYCFVWTMTHKYSNRWKGDKQKKEITE